MTRHSPAEILLMVLAVCGVLAILSLVGLWWIHLPTAGTPHGTSGFIFSVRRVSVISFAKVMVAVVVIAFAVVLSIRSRR